MRFNFACFFYLLFSFHNIFSQIVINEIFPAPQSNQTEWLEIFNPNIGDYFLNKFYITNKNSTSFANLSLIIPSKSFVILASDTSLLPEKNPCTAYQVKLPVLHNDNDVITLRNSDSLLIDSVSYEFPQSWRGYSIERIDWSSIAFGKTNWAKCSKPEGHSICAPNSNALQDFLLVINVSFKNGWIHLLFKNKGRLAIQNLYYRTSLVLKSENDKYETFIDSGRVYIRKSDSLLVEKELYNFLKNTEYDLIEQINFYLDYDSIDVKKAKFISMKLNIPKMFSGLLINEFLYEPEKGCAEFIEIYNNTNDTIFLNGWKFSNHSLDENNTQVVIEDQNCKILPRNFFVVIWDSMFFNCFDDLLNSFQIYYSLRKLSLKNKGDNIRIYDSMEILQDSLSFSPKWHKYNVKSTRNRSLEKVLPNISSGDENNWFTSVDPRGSTPTQPNSIAPEKILEDIECKITPNPFSPKLTNASISLFLPFRQSRITAKIFTLEGVEVRELLTNELFPSKVEIYWDGLDANYNYVSPGAYVLWVEVVDLQSDKVKTAKKVIGVGY